MVCKSHTAQDNRFIYYVSLFYILFGLLFIFTVNSLDYHLSNGLLSLFFIPIFYAAYHYPKRIYLILFGIALLVIFGVIFFIKDRWYFFLETAIPIIILLLTTLEMVYRSNKKLYDSILALKESEELLIENEALFQQFLYHCPICMYIKDQNSNFIRVSSNFEKILGVSTRELIGKNTDVLFLANHAGDIIKNDLRVLNEDKPIEMDDYFNGRFYSIIKFPIHRGDKPVFIGGFAKDITEQKQAEKTKIEKERLDAIAEVASGASHNINNSLQVILGNIEIALHEKNIPERIQACLGNMKISANVAAKSITQLQHFAQKKQKEFMFYAVNINSVIDEAIVQARTVWENALCGSGAEISVQKKYGEVYSVDGNFGELKNVFYNIIKNSAEAMPDGGKLSIETGNTEKGVCIRVVDTGIGMDEQTIKRLFQPFYTTKGYDLGRGLGMVAVHSIIADHNGEIHVKESNPGRGATIEVLLPAGKIKAQRPAKENTGNHTIIARVLFVEDEWMIRDLVKDMLEILGHQVDVASNGADALILLEKNQYNLILSDIGMPLMSGWELAANIKGRFEGTKFAFLTGMGTDISNEEKEKFGLNYILGKPVDMNELKKLLDDVMHAKYSIQ